MYRGSTAVLVPGGKQQQQLSLEKIFKNYAHRYCMNVPNNIIIMSRIPEFIPEMNRPTMNMIGWTANDCKPTAMTITTLLSNMVYFLQ
jgi:hypothetical protein